jgi:hypothetical protein
VLISLPYQCAAQIVKLTRLADRVSVEIDGQPFTAYVYKDGSSRSYCYPILAPDGTRLTRDFPMKQTPGEDTDHPWHRSLWFAHSMVNGIDFWNEGNGDVARSGKRKGRAEVAGVVEAESGPVGVVRVHDRWLGPDGQLICTDERLIRFHADAAGRFIDFDITVHALTGEPLVFGDNKDGTMALRVAQWLTMARKVAGIETGGHGHIVTAAGDRDDEAWGKRADWCDYHAAKDGKTYGIAIFDHPQNLRHPTWWMVRGYGLFGANPFGQHDFEHLEDEPHIGDYGIPAGGSIRLRYRLFFHLGDEKTADVAREYARYANGE